MPISRPRPRPSRSLVAAILLCTAATAGCTADNPTAASSPSRAPDPSPTLTFPAGGADGVFEARPGIYALAIDGRPPTDRPLQALVQLPPGYWIDHGWVIHSGLPVTAPDWNGLSFLDLNGVPSHPCQEGATRVDPGPSVTDLAEALAARPLSGASDPIPVRVAGYEGLYVESSVPDDADINQCPEGKFLAFTTAAGESLWSQTPGEVGRMWILDVDGNRVVINAFHGPESTEEQIAAFTEMVDTIAFSTSP